MLTQDVLSVSEFMDFQGLLNKLWVRRGLAFLLGSLGALAFAPFFIFPALLLSISGIWSLLEQDIENKASVGKIFWLGWWFGLGHFTAGLYWITFALTVDLASFWWLIPFALFGIPAILAVFTGFSFVFTAFWPYRGLSRAFAFCAIWIGVEWLRGHLFTGFPWNLAGYAWAFSSEMTQTASLAGVYGLSLLTLLMGVSLGYFARKNLFERNIAFSIFLMAGLFWAWGHYRLLHSDILSAPPLAIRLVQPSISQTLKWDPVEKQANFKTLLELSTQPSPLPLKAIIWPESAIPFFLEQEPFLRAYIGSKMPRGALLFTGGLRRTDP
jgi:apolipoprotein N-acyltransferase